MVHRNPRDRSRTHPGRHEASIYKNTRPPADQGGWMALAQDLLESPSFATLSVNAFKVLFRIIIENIAHNRLRNGKLIVTHSQFIAYGVTPEYVGDAVDELSFKGLIKVRRGRGGQGTAHPNLYRLTFTGDCEGNPATNEWKRLGEDCNVKWRNSRASFSCKRSKYGRKKIRR